LQSEGQRGAAAAISRECREREACCRNTSSDYLREREQRGAERVPYKRGEREREQRECLIESCAERPERW